MDELILASGPATRKRAGEYPISDDISVASSDSLNSVSCFDVAKLESILPHEIDSWLGDLVDFNPDHHDSLEHQERKDKGTSSPSSFRNSGRRSKEKDAPKRPLSAYNFFFQFAHRAVLQETGGKVEFKHLGGIIGKMWKNLDSDERQKYERKARDELKRYHKEMQIWRKKRRSQLKGHSTSQTQINQVSQAQDFPSNSSQEECRFRSLEPTVSDKRTYAYPAAGHVTMPFFFQNSAPQVGCWTACTSAQGSIPVVFPKVSDPPLKQPVGQRLISPASLGTGFSLISDKRFPHPQVMLPPMPQNPAEMFIANPFYSGHDVMDSTPAVERFNRGSEMNVDDSNARQQPVQVQYKCYRMRQSQFNEYLSQITDKNR